MGSRALKKELYKILGSENFESSMCRLHGYAPRKIINPLFSFFYSPEDLIKWRAITATGEVVSALANQDMESARVIMRRLIWHLNDESGGIGWGSPEAMGDIMARHAGLASEYACILASYIMPEGNFIEYESLQRGVLWGIGRLAHARPWLLNDSILDLLPFLKSGDAFVRGHAVWAAGAFDTHLFHPLLMTLRQDHTKIPLYSNRQLAVHTIAELSVDALKTIKT